MHLAGRSLLLCALLPACLLPGSCAAERAARRSVRPAAAPAPLGNPLVGLVPFVGGGSSAYPHSLEFAAVPFAALVDGRGAFTWARLESLLATVAGRGHQLICRVVLDAPGEESALPAGLRAQGVGVTEYRVDGLRAQSPDYEHPALRTMLREFIAAFGARYDGDPRLGYVTAGLLGAWGEWHTWPRPELFASKDVQREVLAAYAAAFQRTPVLLRRPVGSGDPAYAATTRWPFGYHDDSFAFATLDTGRAADAWYFVPMLRRAGELERWRTHPIGGEVRPEAQAALFTGAPPPEGAQDFAACVEATHVSWLIAQRAFTGGAVARRRTAAAVARMGYVMRVERVAWRRRGGDALDVEVTIANHGVAPFYADWPCEIAVQDAAGTLLCTARAAATLQHLQPGAAPRALRATLPVAGRAGRGARLLLRVVHPLPSGTPLRFANAGQDRDRAGWLTLADLRG